ncbi:glycosyltransferase family 4 protein [Polaromonas sp. AER18D-145]|uniref:glycosyltransferase family 4 protein n=1 Tax=Polaromonas sp. AER18D-145 TaxID=1977060 RepID=UPI000BBB7A15|nr:glycosyltransferase family 4 protein [Polaromonas sp. AER18D-145]
MKILVVSQYFWPESFLINDFVAKLCEQGHVVVVATGKPNYPDGKVHAGYRAAGVGYERFLNKVDVFRVPIWPRGNGSALNLLLNYGSFVVSAAVLLPWLLRSRAFDAILVFAPSPVTQVIPAILLKLLKRAHLALWVQDLWPESLAATGFVSNRTILKMVGWMVRFMYAMCDTLLVQSRAFYEPVARYAARDKLVYFPNSINPDVPADSGVPLPAALSHELAQCFTVVFAGNIGRAQAVETLVEAAVLLKNNTDVRLVLVGSGSMLDWARNQKVLLKLDNLVLPGRFPADLMPQLFDKASALLVSLKSGGALAYTVPSKIQAYLAAGRPIIASLQGEGAKVVVEAGAGMTCEPENAAALAACILSLKALTPFERDTMGRSGRSYFNEHFDMNRQVGRLVEILQARRAGLKG